MRFPWFVDIDVTFSWNRHYFKALAMSTEAMQRHRPFSFSLGFRRETVCASHILSEFKKLREVVRKVACPITLIFNKRRAFSLQLSSILFGFSSHQAIFSLTLSLTLPRSLSISHACYFCITFAAQDILFTIHRVEGTKEKGVQPK